MGSTLGLMPGYTRVILVYGNEKDRGTTGQQEEKKMQRK